MDYLLDTNIIIHLARDKAMARHLESVYGFGSAGVGMRISAVTIGEAESLALGGGWGGPKHARMRGFLSRSRVYDVTAADSNLIFWYAQLDVLSRSPAAGATFTGRRMGKNDLWIAATAVAYQLPLVTTDKDFDHLLGMIDLRYVDPSHGAP